MLPPTPSEIERVAEYVRSQAPDLTVLFVQRVYAETVLDIRHDVWDVHTDTDRWWVITPPMNLYAQDQFPNPDLALSFHVGLCVRIPRGERQQLSELPAEPFLKCFRYLQEAADALAQAQEVGDYQAVGVRCREALLAFVAAAQAVIPWTSTQEAPKKADLRAWADHICSVALSGDSHKERRRLCKTLLDSAWTFANWLAHAHSSHWHDAEAAVAVAENAIGICSSAVIRHVRGVPEQCPTCGSQRLSPQRGYHRDAPGVVWERPSCHRCGWAGEPVPVDGVPEPHTESAPGSPEGDCIIPTVPIRHLRRPKAKDIE